jgi:hypothetical protein
MSDSEPRTPRFNHVAMSVPAELLRERGRADILRFYAEVFGWTEMPSTTEDGVRLVLRAHSNEQFVFLVADPNPMQCPKGDHFGISVATPRELEGLRERAQKFRERDDRVEIVDVQPQDWKFLKLHSVYLRYLLPMMIEVQCFEWAEGFGAAKLPES